MGSTELRRGGYFSFIVLVMDINPRLQAKLLGSSFFVTFFRWLAPLRAMVFRSRAVWLTSFKAVVMTATSCDVDIVSGELQSEVHDSRSNRPTAVGSY